MAKTNTGLVAYCKEQLGRPYWYGTFGNTSTRELYNYKKKQYPGEYQWACPASQLGVRVHDCIGLIKGYLWSSTSTSAPGYYASQDVSANGMLQKCTTKGSIGSMPDIPGILVFLPGHVGVYIGNGEVIEAKGHAYGVVKTKLKGRGWTSWGKCPWITYTTSSAKTTTTTTSGKKSVDTLAKEVINGKWGNGEERKKKLTAAGYNYNTVQKRVNELLASSTKNNTKTVTQLAKEVIQGKWGNGAERKKRLEAAGYNYNTVQKKVNELLK